MSLQLPEKPVIGRCKVRAVRGVREDDPSQLRELRHRLACDVERLGEEEEEYNIADVQAVGDEVTRHALAIDDGERLASVEKKEDIMSVYHCAPHVFNGKGERAVHDQNK